MTDNEIIKALECCLSSNDLIACWKCPAVKLNICCDGSTKISNGIVNSVLDLIIRQQAEIEKLQTVIFKKEDLMQLLHKEHQQTVDELQRKNAELQYENLQMIASIENLKSKATKEFAERLCEGRVSNDPVVIAVKVELEEMTEDKGK